MYHLQENWGNICCAFTNKGLGFFPVVERGKEEKTQKTGGKYRLFLLLLCLVREFVSIYWTHVNLLKSFQMFASHVCFNLLYLSCKFCPLNWTLPPFLDLSLLGSRWFYVEHNLLVSKGITILGILISKDSLTFQFLPFHLDIAVAARDLVQISSGWKLCTLQANFLVTRNRSTIVLTMLSLKGNSWGKQKEGRLQLKVDVL